VEFLFKGKCETQRQGILRQIIEFVVVLLVGESFCCSPALLRVISVADRGYCNTHGQARWWGEWGERGARDPRTGHRWL
jgi:hypothetical protein